MAQARRHAVFLALIAFPIAAFADLSQTVTLTSSGQSNLNLDTGTTSTSGGDIQFGASGITPQGNATAVNQSSFTLPANFAGLTQLIVELYSGYSKSPIPISALTPQQGGFVDVFLVHTNGGHWAKLMVTSISGSSTITLQFTTFGVSGSGGGSSGPPAITAVENNSSGIVAGLPNYGIAPSSIFVIIGTGLADAGTPTLQDTAKGLPLTLNGASISVTVGGVTVRPPIYYTSPTQIAAVLPAATPLGTGTVTVTYKGVASNAAPILVVASALGINTFFTSSGVATDAVTGALLTFSSSGTPGENIVLWTTGLGADPADSDTTYTSTPHAVNTPLQIYIGGMLATILYQGSAGYPGVDQINVTIPASVPNGCWTSVAAFAGGLLSNVATIPINSGGGPCVDPVSGITGVQIAPATPRDLRTGVVVLTQTNKQQSNGNMVFNTNADGAFEDYTGIYTPTNQVSPGGCIVGLLTPVTPGSFTGLDPGGISLTGPNGVPIALANQLGIAGAYNLALTAGAIPQSGGTFEFNGSGGASVGSFKADLVFQNPLMSWTNQNVAATVDRTKDLTVAWTGGNPGSYIFVTGTSSSGGLSVGFTCLGHVDDGRLTVPSYILSAMLAGKGGIEIQNDFYLKLGASGLDIGIAQGEIGISATATFK